MSGTRVGPTFLAILVRQFQALRAGDRFFWLNQGFDSTTATMISNTRLSDIITRNTDSTNVRRNVFVISSPVTTPHVAMPSKINTNGRQMIVN